ncbi:Amidohydrolase [uncultured archaeon]|nr:Amidohydrolase [uncultured archaeon]
MKKIDIHCHTTKKQIGGRSATLESIYQEMNKYEIEKTVVLATYFPHRGTGITNFRLFNWIRDKPEFLMFGSLDFEHYFNTGINELNELGELGYLSGIKLYTSYQNIDLKSNKINELVKVSRNFKVPLMFHCGYSYSAMSTLGKIAITDVVKASDLEFLAKDNPDVKIIASHLSKPFLKDLTEVVKRNNNFYTDMSGVVDFDSTKQEKEEAVLEVKSFLYECGPNKLLFGTDFPIQSHEDSVYFVEEAMKGFNELDKMKVYYHNARRLLK